MTMTPLASGADAARAARVRSRRAARRAPGRRPRWLTVVVGTMLATVTALPAAAIADQTPAATAAPSLAVGFRAAAGADGILRPDGRLVVSLAATNPTGAPVGAGTVELAVSSGPLATRTAVDEWLEGESSPRLSDVGSMPLGGMGPYGTSTATRTVEVGDDLVPGVYALRGTYESPQGTLVSRGVWVVPEEEDAGAAVAVVVPVTAGPLTTGLLTAEQLATLTARGGDLQMLLDAVRGTPAILAIDPAIPAAIRVLGTLAPESATEWLADLMSLPNSRFALQFGDADLAVQHAAGLDDLLQVTTLTPYIDPNGFSATAEPTPTPAADGTVVLPDLDQLTDIGSARSHVYWPAGGTADAELAAFLDEAGGTAATPLILVPSRSVTGEDGARAEADDAQLLIYDSGVSAALLAASTAETSVERSAALAEASAYGTFTASDVSLLVTVDRSAERSAAGLRAAVRAATRLDGREGVGLGALAMTGASAQVTFEDAEEDPARTTALERFAGDETELAAFATILDDPTLLTGPERATILQLMGNGWLPTPGRWGDAAAQHREATQARLDSVGIVPAPDINLLGSSAPLTFSVRNDLPWPVSLVLVTQPNDPRLVVQKTTEVAAGAAQTTRVDVPVEARVGSGTSSLDLRLRSHHLVPIGDPVTVEVTVRAEWESVGIVVIAVLVTALVAMGVVRTVLRLRRRGRPQNDTADDTIAGDDAGAKERADG
jgi:hypothetical protein